MEKVNIKMNEQELQPGAKYSPGVTTELLKVVNVLITKINEIVEEVNTLKK